MKPFLAVLALAALCLATERVARAQAAETEPAIEGPGAAPLGSPLEAKSTRSALFCAYESQSSADIHVLLCRFEESETCALANPVPLRSMILRYDAVKIIGIGSTPEGCSRVTFTGSLKAN